MEHDLTAQDAAAELGISLPTLYAYVSRGLIRSEASGGSQRQRRYNQEDIQKLKQRKELRQSPVKAVEQSLHWGMPVLESKLTLIENGQFYYRGLNAVTLAEGFAFEEVAALLWLGDLKADLARIFGRAGGWDWSHIHQQLTQAPGLTPLEAFQTILPLAAAQDPSAYDFRTQSVVQAGGRILLLLASIASGEDVRSPESSTWPGIISRHLAQSWALDQAQSASLINAALILSADHELNVSSFTARVVASARATLYQVVIAGLAAIQGIRHGGMVARVEALLREIPSPELAERLLAARLKRGEALPGFGHQLYPQGDPRARLLLDRIAALDPDADSLALVRSIETSAYALIQEKPTIDFALAVLARALHLPENSAATLFALGRTAGWIAHALEQYQLEELIRPRAKYNGPVVLSTTPHLLPPRF